MWKYGSMSVYCHYPWFHAMQSQSYRRKEFKKKCYSFQTDFMMVYGQSFCCNWIVVVVFFIFLFFYKLHISELICLMFLANNNQFWQFRKKHNITRSYLWSFTRPNVFSIIVKKKFICLFGIPRFFSKIQLTYGMRLNLFCKSLAYLCCKCLHIEIF